MPTFGRYGTFPLRFGGAKPRVQTILESLNSARGTAYDVTETSHVWVENMALARALAEVWDVNEMMGNQVVPLKMGLLLERWEKILGITVSPSATRAARRRVVHALMSRTGKTPNYQTLKDLLEVAMAPLTISSIAHSAPGDAGVVANWPGGWHVVSVGTTPPTVGLTGVSAGNYQVVIEIIAGGVLGVSTFRWASNGVSFSATQATAASVVLGDTGLTATFAAGTYDVTNQYFANTFVYGWTSSVGHSAIIVDKPSWMSEATYYELISQAQMVADSFLPSWTSFDFVRDGSVPGEFRLDEDGNLDNQRLSA